MVVLFTDPAAAAAYVEQFQPKSVTNVDAWLWTPSAAEDAYGSDAEYVADAKPREVSVDELKELELEPTWHIRVNSAILVQGYRPDEKRGNSGGVIVTQHTEGELPNSWEREVVLYLPTPEAVERLTGQVIIQSDFAFSVVESS